MSTVILDPGRSWATAREAVARVIEEQLTPPKGRKVSEWAADFRVLPAETTAAPGPWMNEQTPYLVGIMDACLEPGIEDVTFQKCAQVGGSEVLNNLCGYFIHQDPAPILLVSSGDKEAKAYSKERIAPMIEATPVLKNRIEAAGDDTTLSKSFVGGHLAIAGANAPAGLRSRPRRVLLLDEVDSYPPSAGHEGDPVGLAEARTTTFWNRVIVRVSTPTLEGLSRIEASVKEADEIRLFCVPCPHCAHMQPLRFGNLKWESDEGIHLPETAEYLCQACGALIPERRKLWMLEHGDWLPHEEAEKVEQDTMSVAATWASAWVPCEPHPHPRSVAFTGFNQLYSPWKPWREVVTSFLDAKADRMRLQVWVNTTLGEVFREAGYQLDAEPLMKRAEVYPENPVPPGVLLITAGVDVQGDRLEVELVGWGLNYESWSLDYMRIPGDPSLEGGVWSTLDHVLARTFDHPAGVKLRIYATAVDSGYHTQAVYRYCSARFAANVWAVKGRPGEGRPIWDKPSESVRKKIKVPLYPIGVDTAKTALYGHLRVQRPHDWSGDAIPGFCHFPARAPYDQEYFRQLTSEKAVVRQNKLGYLVREWVRRPGRRAETLDCRIYAFGAHEGAYFTGIRLDQLKAAIESGGAPQQTRRVRRKGEQPG